MTLGESGYTGKGMRIAILDTGKLTTVATLDFTVDILGDGIDLNGLVIFPAAE